MLTQPAQHFRELFFSKQRLCQAWGASAGQRVNPYTADQAVAGVSQNMPGMEIKGVSICTGPSAGPEVGPCAIIKESGPAKRSYLVDPFRQRFSCVTISVSERTVQLPRQELRHFRPDRLALLFGKLYT